MYTIAFEEEVVTAKPYNSHFFMTDYSGGVESVVNSTGEIEHLRKFLNIGGCWYLVSDEAVPELVKTNKTESYSIDLRDTTDPVFQQISDKLAEATALVEVAVGILKARQQENDEII